MVNLATVNFYLVLISARNQIVLLNHTRTLNLKKKGLTKNARPLFYSFLVVTIGNPMGFTVGIDFYRETKVDCGNNGQFIFITNGNIKGFPV